MVYRYYHNFIFISLIVNVVEGGMLTCSSTVSQNKRSIRKIKSPKS